MGKIDYRANVQYILDNFENLNLADNDLKTLKDTLSFLKLHAQQQIIEQSVLGNEDLKSKIADAQDSIRAKIEEISKNIDENEGKLDYPEYEEKPKEDGVLDSLYEEAQKNERKDYDAAKFEFEYNDKPIIQQKIEALKSSIERLEKLSTKLDDPEKFIGEVLTPNDNEEYNRLIDICATNMANGYMEMEYYGNNPLFTRVENKDSTSPMKGYVPNPEAIDGFLKLIRDPELIKELEGHDKLLAAAKGNEKSLREAEKENQEVKDFDEMLNDPDSTCRDVEKLIREVGTLRHDKKEAQENLRKFQLPAKTNAFMRFIGKITGKTKKEQIQRDNLEHDVEAFDVKLGKINEDEHKSKLMQSPTYAKYISLAERDINRDRNSNDSMEEFLTYGHSNMHEYVQSRSKSVCSTSENRLKEAEKKARESKEVLDESYGNLTDEAKKLVDNGVGSYGLQSKYVTREARDRYRVSPFVASLSLEMLMKDRGIKSAKELEDIGIKLTLEDIVGYNEVINKKLDEAEQNLQEIGKEQKEIEDGIEY